MGVRASECFHMHYDMRKNAKNILRFFEQSVSPSES
jgi:hypothetical protein